MQNEKSVLFGVKNEEKNCFVLVKKSWKKGKKKKFGRKKKKIPKSYDTSL